jgi:hypothetical protein
MNVSNKPSVTLRLLIGTTALALFSLVLTACEKTSTTEASLCGDNNSLCVSRQALLDTGIVVFENCAGCHGPLGNGQGHGAPVLANSDYVMGSKARLIKTILHGNSTPIVVNGKSYPGGGMPSWDGSLSNLEIAGVLTYVRSVLNDSLTSNCVADPVVDGQYNCTKTARDSQVRIADTVAVWEVKAVRDSIGPSSAQ